MKLVFSYLLILMNLALGVNILNATLPQDDILYSVGLDLRKAELIAQQKKYSEALDILGKVRSRLEAQGIDENLYFFYLTAISKEHDIYIATGDYTKASDFLVTEVKQLLRQHESNPNIVMMTYSQTMGQLPPYEKGGKYKEALTVYRLFENSPQLHSTYQTINRNKISQLEKDLAGNKVVAPISRHTPSQRSPPEKEPQNNADIEKQLAELEAQSRQMAEAMRIQKAMESGNINQNDISALMALEEASGDLDSENKAELEQLKSVMALKEQLDSEGITTADLSGKSAFMQQLNEASGGEMNEQLAGITEQITDLLGIESIDQLQNLDLSDMNLNLDLIEKMTMEEGIDMPKDSVAQAWNTLKNQDSLLYNKQKKISENNLAQLQTRPSGSTSAVTELIYLYNANMRLKNYEDAEQNLKQLESKYSTLPKAKKSEFPEGIIAISYWGLQFAQNEYNKALNYLQDALEKNEYLESYLHETIAITHFQLKDFKNAKQFLKKAILTEQLQNAKADSKSLVRLKQLYFFTAIANGDYEEALKGLQKLPLDSNTDKNKSLFDLHLTSQLGMAIASARTDRHDKANQYMSDYLKSVNDKIFELNLITEVRMEENEEHYISDNIFFFLDEERTSPSSITGLGYDAALLFKEFQLNSDRVMAENYLKTDDIELKNLYFDYIRIKEKSKDLQNNEDQKGKLADYDRAYQKILHKKNLAGISELFDTSKLSFTTIKNALNNNEAALEFVSYAPYRFEANSETVFYGVFVLKNSSTYPEFIPLGKDAEIQQILNSANTENSTADLVKGIYDTQKTALYTAIWKPLTASLKGINKIYYAPAGLLHNLSFDAFGITGTSRLSDQFELVRMASTKNIVHHKTNDRSRNYTNVALMGGIDYEPVDSSIQATETRSGERSDIFKNLPGTQKEIDQIEGLLMAQGINVSKESGQKATEERFYTFAKSSPDILHVATHAFYLESELENPFLISENEGFRLIRKIEDPMNRSGMAFAGANHFWTLGKKMPNTNEDGILTANEMAALNLRGTDLVVLSACETAIGKSLSNEGVFGLQRGLKMAGAKKLLLSLWKVDDHVTEKFMTTFYRYLTTEKLPIQEAYIKTRDTIREMRPEPYYWAAFVLVQ